MEMFPYSQIDTSDEEKIILTLNSAGKKIFLQDLYCTDPGVECAQVKLKFIESTNNLSDDSEYDGDFEENTLFTAMLNVESWKVEDIDNNKDVDSQSIVDDFMKLLDEELKKKFLNRFSRAVEYGRKPPLEYVTSEMVTGKACVQYSQIFGDENIENFVFEYKDITYMVDEQYCMNPDCKCNEAMLGFIDVIPDRPVQTIKFAIRLDLITGNYTVENNTGSKEELDEIVKYFIETKTDNLDILKDHYTNMKKMCRLFVVKNGIKKGNTLFKTISVGRNDPCPCGSGLKYKKCCINK